MVPKAGVYWTNRTHPSVVALTMAGTALAATYPQNRSALTSVLARGCVPTWASASVTQGGLVSTVPHPVPQQEWEMLVHHLQPSQQQQRPLGRGFQHGSVRQE
jgi:hypothetical protein